MGEVMSSYIGPVRTWGRRRRNKRFGRWRGRVRWRRRRSRKRRISLGRGSRRSTEREGGSDQGRGDHVRGRGSKVGGGRGRDVRLDNESRKKRSEVLGQFEERLRCRLGNGRLIDGVD
jgi:hypothetical protein